MEQEELGQTSFSPAVFFFFFFFFFSRSPKQEVLLMLQSQLFLQPTADVAAVMATVYSDALAAFGRLCQREDGEPVEEEEESEEQSADADEATVADFKKLQKDLAAVEILSAQSHSMLTRSASSSDPPLQYLFTSPCLGREVCCTGPSTSILQPPARASFKSRCCRRCLHGASGRWSAGCPARCQPTIGIAPSTVRRKDEKEQGKGTKE
jgi:hypothetical protein